MSYNIDTWKTKELRNFRIEMTALYYKEDYLDHPTVDIQMGILTFTGRAEGFELRGVQSGAWFDVDSIESHGEASGTMQEYLKEYVFPHSTGLLSAVLVWEGGDTIERLTVKDGMVEEEAIEL